MYHTSLSEILDFGTVQLSAWSADSKGSYGFTRDSTNQEDSYKHIRISRGKTTHDAV